MIEVVVNGTKHRFEGDPATPLLWFLRDELGLVGTRFGCCTVHVGKEAMRSCGIALSDLKGAVTTIEALGANGLHPLQQAWLDNAVSQCGYCQSGQLMQAAALLAAKPHPSDAEIDEAMAGNLCRCGTYPRIQAAIKQVASVSSETTSKPPVAAPKNTPAPKNTGVRP